MGWRKRYVYRAKSGKRVCEPGYRYASERRAYMDLSPAQRQQVKKILEQQWQERSVSPVYKNKVACPTLLTAAVRFDALDAATRNFYRDED